MLDEVLDLPDDFVIKVCLEHVNAALLYITFDQISYISVAWWLATCTRKPKVPSLSSAASSVQR